MGIDLWQCLSLLLERFEVHKLRKLHLLDCSFSSVLMATLSSWYTENTGFLDTFHFRYQYYLSITAGKILRASLERFITVCPSLSHLVIEYRSHKVLPVSCVIKHGNALPNLRMGGDLWPDSLDKV